MFDTAVEDVSNSRAKFRALTEGTRDDWQLIGGELERFAEKLPERLIAHLKLLRGDYGGFPAIVWSIACRPRPARIRRAETRNMWSAACCTISAIRWGPTITRTSRP
jgi:hypothetical protein